MPFLRNAWYAVAYPEEFDNGATKAITVLAEPLLLFRRSDGSVTALHDRCPHRFAPLSRGKVIEDQVQCAYHGLRFDNSGRCTLNPHGDGTIPKAACVRSYPVTERHGVVWVWMGAPDQADAAALPDLGEIEQRPGWAREHGYLRTAANYQLVIDNLLDLTHALYLHPFLTGSDARRPDPSRVEARLEQAGETVVSIMQTYDDWATPLTHLLWEGAAPDKVDGRANMRWDAPAAMLLDVGFAPPGRPRSEGPSMPSAHLLTPETETTTHYFWIAARDTHVDNDVLGKQLAEGLEAAFSMEDSPMLVACQDRMGTTDLMSLKPVLLPTDAPALRARRVLEARLKAEVGVG
jgi:phenylpropionate dioxygenase-like ring-hydroxylating dioxygenase large terminal subunit